MQNAAKSRSKTRCSTASFTNLLLIVGGMLLPLVMIEVGMRWHHTYVKNRSTYEPASNPRLVFVGKPHAGRDINALGFRDHEYTEKKPAGVFRIIALGDSVTHGFRVDFEELYTKRLEALLNKQDHRYEVMNLGTHQYSTVQEVELLKERGLRLGPDLVILAYVLNDPTPDGLINDFFQCDRVPSLAVDWVAREIKAVLQVQDPFHRLPGCRSFDYYSHLHCDATKWTAVQGAFQELRSLSQAHDFRVLLVIFPLLDNRADASFDGYAWRSIHERIAAEATRNGFPVLDLLTYFAKRRPIELKVASTDQVHPNGIGNEIAASAIHQALLDFGLAPSSF